MSRLCLLPLVLAAASCAALGTRVDPASTPAAPATGAVRPMAPPAPAPPGVLAPGEKLTPERALELVWHQHPQMKRFRSRIGAAYGERIQAALWPNPEMDASLLAERRYKTEAFLTFAQRFELGGKREARVSVAAAQVFLAEQELRETWAELRAGVKDAFVRLAYARQRAELLDQVAAADAERVTLVESLVRAGKIPEPELLRERQAYGRSLAVAQSSAPLVEDSRRQVLTFLGMADAGEPVDVACSMDVSEAPGDAYAELLAMARKNNPALASSKAREAVAEAGLNLAQTKQWSDVTAGLGFLYANYVAGETGRGVLATVKVDLPMWNRYQGEVLSARHGISAAEEGTEAAARDVASRLSQLLADRIGWRRQADALRDQVLPAAGRSVELAESTYASGKAAKMELLERRRERTLVQLELLQAHLMQAVAAVQIEKIAADLAVPPKP